MVTLLSGFYKAVTAHSSNEVWLCGTILKKTLWIQRWRWLTSSLLVFPFVRSSRMQRQIGTPQDLNGTLFNATVRKAYQLDVAMRCEFISILTNKHLEKTKCAPHSSSLFLLCIPSVLQTLSCPFLHFSFPNTNNWEPFFEDRHQSPFHACGSNWL